MEYNIYCDESCHLENDDSNVMSIGAVYCPKDETRRINDNIREIKLRNGIPVDRELKWIKVSPSLLHVYEDIINYFFEENDLHFRIIVIPEKSKLNHKKYNQTHDEWYYKMYYDMLKGILSSSNTYNIYIDIKDTNSYEKSKRLHDVCSNSMYDFSHRTITKLQPIRSNEVQIMQITDLLIGAITHCNRQFPAGEKRSEAKQKLIDLIKSRAKHSLSISTPLRENKINIFMWEADWNVSR